MPSALTINVSASASSLLPTVRPVQPNAVAANIGVEQSQAQIVSISEQAAAQTATNLTPRQEDPKIQLRKRPEPGYGPSLRRKRKKNPGESAESEEQTQEQGDQPTLDLKA